jgi:hypothetical protein
MELFVDWLYIVDHKVHKDIHYLEIAPGQATSVEPN